MPHQDDSDDKTRSPRPQGDRQGKGGKPASAAELCESIKDDLAEIEVLEAEFDPAEAEQADAMIKSAIERAKANPSQTPENEQSWAKKDAKKRNHCGDRQRD